MPMSDRRIVSINAFREMAVFALASIKMSLIFSIRHIFPIRELATELVKFEPQDTANPTTNLVTADSQQADLMNNYVVLLGVAVGINLSRIHKSYKKMQLMHGPLMYNPDIYDREILYIRDRVSESLGFLAAIAFMYNQDFTLEELESIRATLIMGAGYTAGNTLSRSLTFGFKVWQGNYVNDLMEEPGTLREEVKKAVGRAVLYDLRPL